MADHRPCRTGSRRRSRARAASTPSGWRTSSTRYSGRLRICRTRRAGGAGQGSGPPRAESDPTGQFPPPTCPARRSPKGRSTARCRRRVSAGPGVWRLCGRGRARRPSSMATAAAGAKGRPRAGPALPNRPARPPRYLRRRHKKYPKSYSVCGGRAGGEAARNRRRHPCSAGLEPRSFVRGVHPIAGAGIGQRRTIAF